MRHRRDRHLSDDEIALWTHVAQSVRRFEGRTLPTLREAPAPPPAPPVAQGRAAPLPPQPAPAPATIPPLAPIDRRLRTALKRGQQPIEAVLDLHGLYQDEAHGRLRAFLAREHRRGARLVLVITGKGVAETTGDGGERGVLRRVVPHWLRLADLRGIVLGFDEASLQHGGSGALYVRLRRARGGA
jgi:DNA-nicking Smr family endonuclease